MDRSPATRDAAATVRRPFRDQALVARAKAGETEAYEMLVRDNADRLFAVVLRFSAAIVIQVLWQMIDHRFTKAHASEYLDGELGRFGRARIERHISGCPQCRALLASLRRIIGELPGLSSPPRAGIADDVVERLRTGT